MKPINPMEETLFVFSRFMAVGLFFVSGVGKITDYDGTLALMAQNGVPGWLLPLVILLEVGGSIAIAVGFLTRFTSAFMCVFSILAGILFYNGYTHEHLIVWLKNTSCAAGFLLLALGADKGSWNIDTLVRKYLAGHRGGVLVAHPAE
ncbi:MAG: DoxX family protein [Proteobacteria bacterium]|nr:DoxX family protein [Pseudomonadota bacterium]